MSDTLEVVTRKAGGSRDSRRLRRAGMVPAILYGHGEKCVELAAKRLDSSGVEKAVRPGEHAGSDLDDDQPGGGGDVVSKRIGHGERGADAERNKASILLSRRGSRPPRPGGRRPHRGRATNPAARHAPVEAFGGNPYSPFVAFLSGLPCGRLR